MQFQYTDIKLNMTSPGKSVAQHSEAKSTFTTSDIFSDYLSIQDQFPHVKKRPKKRVGNKKGRGDGGCVQIQNFKDTWDKAIEENSVYRDVTAVEDQNNQE